MTLVVRNVDRTKVAILVVSVPEGRILAALYGMIAQNPNVIIVAVRSTPYTDDPSLRLMYILCEIDSTLSHAHSLCSPYFAPGEDLLKQGGFLSCISG